MTFRANQSQLTERITHTGPLWRWTTASAPAAWHFITIDGAAGEALGATALMRRLEGLAKGFGSLRVEARIGDSAFKTSVFPSRELGWLLPVKAAVRKAEGIGEGDAVTVELAF
jgi:arginine/ornithine N-succinyltransferase beta subunit